MKAPASCIWYSAVPGTPYSLRTNLPYSLQPRHPSPNLPQTVVFCIPLQKYTQMSQAFFVLGIMTTLSAIFRSVLFSLCGSGSGSGYGIFGVHHQHLKAVKASGGACLGLGLAVGFRVGARTTAGRE